MPNGHDYNDNGVEFPSLMSQSELLFDPMKSVNGMAQRTYDDSSLLPNWSSDGVSALDKVDAYIYAARDVSKS